MGHGMAASCHMCLLTAFHHLYLLMHITAILPPHVYIRDRHSPLFSYLLLDTGPRTGTMARLPHCFLPHHFAWRDMNMEEKNKTKTRNTSSPFCHSATTAAPSHPVRPLPLLASQHALPYHFSLVSIQQNIHFSLC